MRRILPLFALLIAACSSSGSSARSDDATPQAPPVPPQLAEAIFAGGCFWCMETAFEGVEGVLSSTSGYTGGRVRSPSYEAVSSGGTGHAEAVRVVFDPTRTTYERLLEIFWHNIDPTQADGQFCDHGNQYRSAIFVVNAEQRRLAEASRERVRAQLDARIVTEIADAGPFWVAEDYHQDFFRTNPVRYQTYRLGCGRDRRLTELWGSAPTH